MELGEFRREGHWPVPLHQNFEVKKNPDPICPGPGLHHCFVLGEKEAIETQFEYVKILPLNGYNEEMEEFTVDFSFRQSTLSNRDDGLVSYAIPDQYNEFVISLEGGLISGKQIRERGLLSTKPNVFDRVTIVKSKGELEFYFNRRLIETKSLSKTVGMNTTGVWVLGQEQDRLGGGFSIDQQFHGHICDFQIWDKAFDESKVTKLFSDISSVKKGNIFDNPPSYEWQYKKE